MATSRDINSALDTVKTVEVLELPERLPLLRKTKNLRDHLRKSVSG